LLGFTPAPGGGLLVSYGDGSVGVIGSDKSDFEALEAAVNAEVDLANMAALLEWMLPYIWEEMERRRPWTNEEIFEELHYTFVSWFCFRGTASTGGRTMRTSMTARELRLARSFAVRGATRLSAAELATGERLGARLGRTLRQAPDKDYDYIDEFGNLYDAMGAPGVSAFWNEKQFFRSIDKHIVKSTNGVKTVIDLAGFTLEQRAAVRAYVDALPAAEQAVIIRLGVW